MNLTWRFQLADFTRSDLALRHGVDNVPSEPNIANLRRLCETILQPICDWYGPVQITSGFRCQQLNELLKSKPTSAHVDGRAVDFVPTGPAHRDLLGFAVTLAKTSLAFDQLIYEFGGWLHISVSKADEKPRRETLTIDHLGVREGLHPIRPKASGVKK